MNRSELDKNLNELAAGDLEPGHDINDHPCMVAIRAMDSLHKDIESLRAIVTNKHSGSKRMQTLIRMGHTDSY